MMNRSIFSGYGAKRDSVFAPLPSSHRLRGECVLRIEQSRFASDLFAAVTWMARKASLVLPNPVDGGIPSNGLAGGEGFGARMRWWSRGWRCSTA